MIHDRDIDRFGIDLARAIRTLPPKQKDAILYCHILGFSEGEAARILCCSQPALHYRLCTAYGSLRTIIVGGLIKTA